MINLRKLKNGKRYDVRLRDPSGRLYTKSFSSKRDAETYEAKMLLEKTVGTWMDPKLGRIKLSDWSSQWMEQRGDLRPRTRELYLGLLSHHILPHLGRIELSKLSPTVVRSWYSKLTCETGPGASTSAKSYRLLRAIMQTAVSDGIIVRNPCQVDKAGVERAAERPVPTIVELGKLADAIHPRMRLLILLAAWCGLRRGELLGLYRSDIDLMEKTVKVDRAVVELTNGKRVIGAPKTEAGRRTVAIPPHL
ncbi:MAG: site-specific integrase, partial [Acidimicrobiales bacterium]|nr:site-specific integrase [Acidimicrobiales bacterium]